jgi:glycerol-3-phosphate dehydrogenase
MAEHAIDKAIDHAGLKKANPIAIGCKTKELKIHGYAESNEVSHLSIYGSDAALIKKIMEEDISLSGKIHPQYPYNKAEVKWMLQNEMAITVEDILARRIRLLFLDARAAMEAAPVVATVMAKELNKDEQWITEQVTNFKILAEGYLIKPQQ